MAKISFQTPITIKKAIDEIDKKNYLLPAIQRDFVWKPEQIGRLFDSLMRDYPIGSFLFWKVEGKRKNDFQFYEFINKYSKLEETENPEAKILDNNDIISILDGQQRLTALNIGLRGIYAYKTPYKKYNDPDAYPERKLFLNLLKKPKEDDLEVDLEYEFKFLTNDELNNANESDCWFEVGNILDFRNNGDVLQFIDGLDDDQNKFALVKPLSRLFEIINKEKVINYYLEEDEELDKVLNIFIRVNSGGTQLSYSDLLLSIAAAQWENKDAKKEINSFVKKLNQIGSGFKFDKDFVLKSCLVLNDFKDIAFKVDNFNKENMLKIENSWKNISNSLYIAVKLLSSFGYNRDVISSNNSIIPIAYYILKSEAPNNFVEQSKNYEDKNLIQKWFNVCQLKRTFGGTSDNVLRRMRDVIAQNNSEFPFNKIVEKQKGTAKSLDFDENDIESLFNYKYGRMYTFSVLALLYPSLDFKNLFHVDHIHPRSFFTERRLKSKGMNESKISFYKENFDKIANLQLLEGPVNEEKLNKDFKEWFDAKYPKEDRMVDRLDFMNKNHIPNIDLSFENFEEFIDKRKELLTHKFKDILQF